MVSTSSLTKALSEKNARKTQNKTRRERLLRAARCYLLATAEGGFRRVRRYAAGPFEVKASKKSKLSPALAGLFSASGTLREWVLQPDVGHGLFRRFEPRDRRWRRKWPP